MNQQQQEQESNQMKMLNLMRKWEIQVNNYSYYFIFEKPCGYQQLVFIPKYFCVMDMYKMVLNNLTGKTTFSFEPYNIPIRFYLDFQENIKTCHVCSSFSSSSSSSFFTSSFIKEEEEKKDVVHGNSEIAKKKTHEEEEEENHNMDICEECENACGDCQISAEEDLFLSKIGNCEFAYMKVSDFIQYCSLKPIFNVNQFPFAVYRIYYDYV